MKMKKLLKKIAMDEKGINTVEIVVLVAIAIGLALIFREQVTGFIKSILDSFKSGVFALPS
jgi:Flp pilus assembly pilin Flp